jgi:hypothetical protein
MNFQLPDEESPESKPMPIVFAVPLGSDAQVPEVAERPTNARPVDGFALNEKRATKQKPAFATPLPIHVRAESLRSPATSFALVPLVNRVRRLCVWRFELVRVGCVTVPVDVNVHPLAVPGVEPEAGRHSAAEVSL